MENCIIISCDGGMTDIRIMLWRGKWAVERRTCSPCYQGELEKYSPWKPVNAPAFTCPRAALSWVAGNCFGWEEDRPAEAKPDALPGDPYLDGEPYQENLQNCRFCNRSDCVSVLTGHDCPVKEQLERRQYWDEMEQRDY